MLREGGHSCLWCDTGMRATYWLPRTSPRGCSSAATQVILAGREWVVVKHRPAYAWHTHREDADRPRWRRPPADLGVIECPAFPAIWVIPASCSKKVDWAVRCIAIRSPLTHHLSRFLAILPAEADFRQSKVLPAAREHIRGSGDRQHRLTARHRHSQHDHPNRAYRQHSKTASSH